MTEEIWCDQPVLVLGGGDAVTVSPVAAFFSFVPVIIPAVLAVKYVLSMKNEGHSSAGDHRRQTA